MIAPLSTYRESSRLIVDRPKAPIIREERNTVDLWVCTVGVHRFAFSDLEAALAFRDEWNDERHPEAAEAIVRMRIACVVDDMHRSCPGCRLVPLELPADLFGVLAGRCEDMGIDVSRLVGALIFEHLNHMTPEKSGAGQISHLEGWERRRRPFGKWDLPTASSSAKGGI